MRRLEQRTHISTYIPLSNTLVYFTQLLTKYNTFTYEKLRYKNLVTGKAKSNIFSAKVGAGPSSHKQQLCLAVVSLTLKDNARTLLFS